MTTLLVVAGQWKRKGKSDVIKRVANLKLYDVYVHMVGLLMQ